MWFCYVKVESDFIGRVVGDSLWVVVVWLKFCVVVEFFKFVDFIFCFDVVMFSDVDVDVYFWFVDIFLVNIVIFEWFVSVVNVYVFSLCFVF